MTWADPSPPARRQLEQAIGEVLPGRPVLVRAVREALQGTCAPIEHMGEMGNVEGAPGESINCFVDGSVANPTDPSRAQAGAAVWVPRRPGLRAPEWHRAVQEHTKVEKRGDGEAI
eukprot:4409605-Alexandrium_andersonii.AAC.1